MMEVVGAAASIVSIIAFSAKATKFLEEFLQGFSDQTAVDLLHDISMSAKILTDVKVLCEKISRTQSDPIEKSDSRVASLLIQVKNCTQDLVEWYAVAKAMPKNNGKLGPKRVLNQFLVAISKRSRLNVCEKFRMHQDNLKTALALFGRYEIFQTGIPGAFLPLANIKFQQ